MFQVDLCAASAFVVVFGAAVTSKVRSRQAFEAFTDSLAQFGFTNHHQRSSLALAVIVLELVSMALTVLTGAPGLLRFGLATALLAAFSVALWLAGRGGDQVACHCFGSASPTPPGLHLIVNSALIALGALAIVLPVTAATAGDRVFAGGLGVILGIGCVTASSLLQVLAPRAGLLQTIRR
jgi:hypothetical protein